MCPIATGTTTVWFESSGSLGNNDVVYFDNVDITGETRTVQTYAGTAPPTIFSGGDLRGVAPSPKDAARAARMFDAACKDNFASGCSNIRIQIIKAIELQMKNSTQ